MDLPSAQLCLECTCQARTGAMYNVYVVAIRRPPLVVGEEANKRTTFGLTAINRSPFNLQRSGLIERGGVVVVIILCDDGC